MRRWRRWAAAALVALAAAAITVLLSGGDAAVDRDVREPWDLIRMSSDARTLSVFHEDPHCFTRKLAPEVRETGDVVDIIVRYRHRAVPDGYACTLDLRYTQTVVRLAHPLGSRRLTGGGKGIRDDFGRLVPGLVCPAARAYPADAAALRTSFGRSWRRRCTRPTPSGLRRFALLRQSRSAADGGRDRWQKATDRQSPVVLHPDQLRGAWRPARVWLIPGPAHACLEVRWADWERADGTCGRATTVAGRGLALASTCRRGHPRREVFVTGVVPPNVTQVRLYRGARRIASARPHRGVFLIRGQRPTHLVAGDRRLPFGRPSGYCD